MVCPKCKTDSAHRSHRVGLGERLAGLVGYHPYRCRRCKHRFPSRAGASPAPASSELRRVEQEISATRASLRWRRKQRDLILFGGALLVFAVILYFLTRPPSLGG